MGKGYIETGRNLQEFYFENISWSELFGRFGVDVKLSVRLRSKGRLSNLIYMRHYYCRSFITE